MDNPGLKTVEINKNKFSSGQIPEVINILYIFVFFFIGMPHACMRRRSIL